MRGAEGYVRAPLGASGVQGVGASDVGAAASRLVPCSGKSERGGCARRGTARHDAGYMEYGRGLAAGIMEYGRGCH